MDQLLRGARLALPLAQVRRETDVSRGLAGFRRWRFESDIRLIEELGLGDRVRQTGFVPDEEMSALYSGAECLVMPSWYEGFGIPVVEAMACGLPVVAVPALATEIGATVSAMVLTVFAPMAFISSKSLTTEFHSSFQ